MYLLCFQRCAEIQRASLSLKKSTFGELSAEVAETLQLIGGVEMTQGHMRHAHRTLKKVNQIILLYSYALIHIHKILIKRFFLQSNEFGMTFKLLYWYCCEINFNKSFMRFTFIWFFFVWKVITWFSVNVDLSLVAYFKLPSYSVS